MNSADIAYNKLYLIDDARFLQIDALVYRIKNGQNKVNACVSELQFRKR
ncbi:hypothetical protein [Bartonella bovis]|nr:hypothetical protein [Bartonella bovis]